MGVFRTIMLVLLYIVNLNICYSQKNDSCNMKGAAEHNTNLIKRLYRYFDDSNKEKAYKALDISFVVGPNYSTDTKFGIGVVASGLYRKDKQDLSISPSNISLYGDLTISGCYVLGVKGNSVFPKAKYRLDYDTYLSSIPSRYWGIGYSNGNSKDGYTKYTKKDIAVKLDFLKRFGKYTYIGLAGYMQYVKGKNFSDIGYLGGERADNIALGGGPILSYDSRDFIPNPRKGVYLILGQNFFSKFLGSSTSFNRIEVIARYYKQAWKGSIVAFDFQGTFNYGDTPWGLLSLLGGNNEMRGYYKGQYRDKKMI